MLKVIGLSNNCTEIGISPSNIELFIVVNWPPVVFKSSHEDMKEKQQAYKELGPLMPHLLRGYYLLAPIMFKEHLETKRSPTVSCKRINISLEMK